MALAMALARPLQWPARWAHAGRMLRQLGPRRGDV